MTMMNRRVSLMLLLASITFALLPSVSVADKVILGNTAEANHNEHQVEGDKHVLRELQKKKNNKAPTSSPSFAPSTGCTTC